jgi:hypothetical protein
MARSKSLVINILGNNKVGRAVRDATRALQGMGRIAARIGRGMVTAFAGAIAAIGALGTGIAAVTVRSARFNVAMARAWTMADGGIATFRAMREEVMALSSELGVAKDELSSGLYQALSAGVPQETVFDFLRIAAKTAIADGSDIATAVDGITTIINSFGLSAQDAAMVTDKMFATVRGGKTSFAQLADNMSKSSATAAALGVSIDELLAAVMTLTKQGTPTEVALTSLRNIMLSLNGELGDGWAESMTLQDALGKVAVAAGMSATELESIFSKRDITQVFALVGKNADAAASDLDTMRNSTGDLLVAFGKVQQFRYFERIANVLTTVANRFGIAVAEGLDLEQTINHIADRAEELGKDYADAILPYIKDIRAAVDDMLSGDPERVEKGKENIAAMVDGALSRVGPMFDRVGESMGAAIARGIAGGAKRAVSRGVNAYGESQYERMRGGTAHKMFAPFSTVGAFAGGLSADPNASYLGRMGNAFGAAGREIGNVWGGRHELAPDFLTMVRRNNAGVSPGSSAATPLYVKEVEPGGITD